ncbi:MAG TPA: hypothetical protein P5537_01860 [Thauera sp.]|uniref:hypothetical protein n=1 Tax=Thauera sp. TaxID=1905334 RepID=UPI00261727EF|nr:hypothetical protein [Thauera sp.]MCP5226366.1 hypothetical protein [Thauera sp.]HPE03088.1 hypothetical protein [Thauera sp.]HRV76818.1 hypothetical protein [Thauera sp.]
MMKPCKRAFVALALLVLALPAWTQAVVEDAPMLRLDCGGIGLEESERMRAEVGMHALTVFFSTTGGGWVTDVETQVDEPLSGQRVEASCGPIGQVDVPTPGRYRISASYAGERQEHWVDLVPQGGARLSLRWQE